VTVVWPSGRAQIVSDPKVNSVLVISED
jgi:hypothetical protein